MTTLKITDSAGKSAGTLEVSDAVFGIEPNVYAMHQVVRSQMAANRQGTHSTKTRGQVSGGGRKPFRQKGTGRARQGTTRAAQFRHGGVVFGPHPRSYGFKVQNKVVKLAMRSAVSGKLADSELFVVDGFNFEKPSTKQAVAVLEALGIEGRVTIVVNDEDVNSFLSFRNIPTVRIIGASESNTYDLLDNKALLLTTDAVKYIEEVLK
ncbi:MAG: 50S ribosomal protein L4 [Coriobacteriales bacterium]|jgi:large subunit ribosomal protein L4